ncbi:PREDICTED: uncharacterized protein LOC104812255 [Tarenaya hassleriana]|uniref:uncharacterized protein LOC104812255 n=1 Tax=Tarenaya hassleriana TaxID=28532 RepID=UPI00053CA07E|nr:PREDICTED: uncharacterized protein LOC104812255 [Tarenaya hassleriana]XP_010537628.1 PREDICTED: uncharacterized protein LOC104812255 [Tarenaya hassleriana]
MSATIITDQTLLVSTPAPEIVVTVVHQPVQAQKNLGATQADEPEPVTCDCCGLTEECTQSYIDTVRERYMGKWICGLCAEAVKYEVIRTERLITTEEAMARHMNMCNKFKSSSPPPDPTIHLISAMRQILRRTLDSPRMLRSMPSSPSKDDKNEGSAVLSRSGSCFATLTSS